MTESEFRAAFHKRFAHVPPSRRAAALDNIIASDAMNFIKAWELSDNWWAENLIDRVKASHPKLFEPAPTVTQLITLRAQEYEAKMGVPYSPQQRLAEHHRLEAMDGDARVKELGDRELPKLAATEEKAPATQPLRDDVESLDAELLKRFGKTHHEFTAVERRRLHESLKNEINRQASEASNRASALAAANGDTSKLSPTQRLSAFRSEQAAKATNGG